MTRAICEYYCLRLNNPQKPCLSRSTARFFVEFVSSCSESSEFNVVMHEIRGSDEGLQTATLTSLNSTKTSCNRSRQTGFMGIVQSKDNNITRTYMQCTLWQQPVPLVLSSITCLQVAPWGGVTWISILHAQTHANEHIYSQSHSGTFTSTQMCTLTDTVAHISSCMHLYTNTHDRYKSTK